MVVKCIKTSIEDGNTSIINNNMQEYLKVDMEYVVYGIRIFENIKYFMIFDDGHLVEVPSQMFEIIEGKVSQIWVVQNDEANGMTLWPKLFYKKDFFENFSEWEYLERKKFDKLKLLFG